MGYLQGVWDGLRQFLSNPSHTLTIQIWLAAAGTLAIYSVLYRENRAYRLAEHIFIGAASGYGVYVAWTEVLKPRWWDHIVAGEYVWILALVAGAMFYFIYSQKHVWISRLIFGAFMGLYGGMAFKGFAGTNIDQIAASFKPLWGPNQPIGVSINNIIYTLVLLAVMAYFFFSFRHKNALQRVPASTGRWVLMFAFGAMFGATVMARMALLIGRMSFLLFDWIGATYHQIFGVFM